jgi:hypothetical protein
MGLDVYLSRCDDLSAARAAQQAYESETEGFWDKFKGSDEKISDENYAKYKAACAEVAERLGCGEWGEPKAIEKIAQNSVTEPDHLFKIGYLRSSYNEGGINNVMRNARLPGLYEIFAYGDHDEDRDFVPDWNASRERCVAAIDGFEAYLKSPAARFYVAEFRHNPFVDPSELPTSKAEAMDAFMKTAEHRLDKPEGEFSNFSNGLGEFFMKGAKLFGVIYGTANKLLGGGKQPVVYAIIEHADQGAMTWYLNALKITLETIDFVLNHEKPETFFFRWSA